MKTLACLQAFHLKCLKEKHSHYLIRCIMLGIALPGLNYLKFSKAPPILGNMFKSLVGYSKQVRKRKNVLVVQSCPILCDPMDWNPSLLCPWNSPGENTGVNSHSLLQGIFPTQGLNPHLLCLLHCRHILYHLSHQGSPSAILM